MNAAYNERKGYATEKKQLIVGRHTWVYFCDWYI